MCRTVLSSTLAVKHDETNKADIVTESESDNPEDRVQLRGSTVESSKMQAKIRKQRVTLKKYKKLLIAKEVARCSLLRRKAPKRVSNTLLKYLSIEKGIANFARENRIGADSWKRQTGPKANLQTYQRIFGEGLDYLQLKDGRYKTILNRDAAAAFLDLYRYNCVSNIIVICVVKVRVVKLS